MSIGKIFFALVFIIVVFVGIYIALNQTSKGIVQVDEDGGGKFVNSLLWFLPKRIASSSLQDARNREIGFGEALGEKLMDAGTGRPSIMATCVRLGVPITVHAAIGTDIVHQQPTTSGEATGELSFRDFRGLCHQLFQLGNGGVVMNVGSAVILPEVFLKALTVARNLGADAFHFTTANFDMIQHYRPRVNVVQRPTQDGGRGFAFTGHHEIMVPLTFAMIRAALAANGIARP